MLFVTLNDNFSCQEFDHLLCNCSVKGCRQKHNEKDNMSHMWCHAPCDWRGQDRQSPHQPKLNSPYAPTYNGLNFLRCFYPPLGKKQWSGAERSPYLYLYRSSKCGWWCIWFALRAFKGYSSQSGLTQNLM